jgi:hypothetical protein
MMKREEVLKMLALFPGKTIETVLLDDGEANVIFTDKSRAEFTAGYHSSCGDEVELYDQDNNLIVDIDTYKDL